MASPTIRGAAGSNSGAGTAATTPTHTLPTGLTTGDFGLMLLTVMANTTITTTDPTGWSPLAGPVNAGSGTTAARAWLWRRTMDAADSGAAVTGWSSGFNTFRWAVASIVLAGASTTAPSGADLVGWTQDPESANWPLPAIDPSGNDPLLIGMSGSRADAGATGLTTPPTGYTEQVDTISSNASGNKSGAIVATKPITGSANQAALNGTLSNNATQVGWHIAITEPVAVAGRPRPPMLVTLEAAHQAATW